MNFTEAKKLFDTARNKETGKPIANNTRIIKVDDKTYAVRLHETNVVTFHKNGKITLDSGGWRTHTTKERMNDAISEHNFNIIQDKELWYIGTGWNDTNKVLYEDGIVINTKTHKLQTFDLDKARVDAAYVGNICLTYEEWPETDNDMQYILAAVYDLEPALDEIERQAARIKELEADRIEARAQYLLFMNDNPGCIAWNFDELDETEQDALREQARYMLELEEPWAYIQLREAREQIKRLEAAFLRSNAAMRYYQEGNRGPWPQVGEQFKEPYIQKARDALEELRHG